MGRYKTDQSGFSWGKQGKELEIWRKKSASSKKGSSLGKAKKEYNQLKKAIEAHQKNGRTLYESPTVAPKTIEELRAESSRIKEELKSIGNESRQEAKASKSISERKRLNVRARLDETWGPQHDRLKKILSEIHEKDKDSRVEDDYNDFWTDEDTAVDEEEVNIQEMADEDFPF